MSLEQLDGVSSGKSWRSIFRSALASSRIFAFDFFQIFRGKRVVHVKIVIEAGLNGGADGYLRLGKKGFDGLSHQVRGRVPDDLKRLRAFLGDNFHLAPSVRRAVKVDQIAVDLAGESRLGKTSADGSGQIIDRCPCCRALSEPSGKCNL